MEFDTNVGDNDIGNGDGGDDVINSGTGDDQNTGDNFIGDGDGGDDVINSGDGNDLNRGDNFNGNGDGGDDVINSGTGMIPISEIISITSMVMVMVEMML